MNKLIKVLKNFENILSSIAVTFASLVYVQLINMNNGRSTSFVTRDDVDEKTLKNVAKGSNINYTISSYEPMKDMVEEFVRVVKEASLNRNSIDLNEYKIRRKAYLLDSDGIPVIKATDDSLNNTKAGGTEKGSHTVNVTEQILKGFYQVKDGFLVYTYGRDLLLTATMEVMPKFKTILEQSIIKACK